MPIPTPFYTMPVQKIIVGARGSLLSVTQAESVIALLKGKFPHYTFSLKKITTTGDKTKNWQRSEVGIFVKELEEALLRKEIDIAVHSMKDLPSSLSKGLVLAAVGKREDPRDCLVSPEKTSLRSFKKNPVIGTGSLRRKAQVLALRPDSGIKDLRGNIDTRIKKLIAGEFDAIILAMAGLKRLGYLSDKKIPGVFMQPFPCPIMLPACGQGALGIEARAADKRIAGIASEINDEKSFLCVSCERAFLREFGAGCRLPIGAYAQIKGKQIYLRIMAANNDGKRIIRLHRKAPLKDAQSLGKQLAEEVKAVIA